VGFVPLTHLLLICLVPTCHQASLEVAEDYSLRAYLEVLYLKPRVNIFLQGSQIKFRDPLKVLQIQCKKYGPYTPKLPGVAGSITCWFGNSPPALESAPSMAGCTHPHEPCFVSMTRQTCPYVSARGGCCIHHEQVTTQTVESFAVCTFTTRTD
jgi:hypothetical protein